MLSTDDQIEQKIRELKPGSIIFTEDFQEYGSSGAVKVALHRMVKKGLLRTIARGIYTKPKFSKLLNQDVMPSAEQVATAIAEREVATCAGRRGEARRKWNETDLRCGGE